MFLNVRQIVTAVVGAILIVGGLWWCKEIVGRLGSDVKELRESDDLTSKVVIVFFWLLTLVIIFFMTWFLGGIIRGALATL